MGIFKRFITATAALVMGVAVLAQSPDKTVNWNVSQEETGDGLFDLTFSADILPGWHIYSASDKTSPTAFEFEEAEGYEPVGSLEDIDSPSDNGENLIFERNARFRQKVRLTSDSADVKGYITCMVCRDGMCTMVDKDIEISLKKAVNKNVSTQNSVVSSPVNESNNASSGNSLWTLLLEAVLWGFAMLLTPCVFPMVPMTVSFFLKSSASPSIGRMKAAVYGISIILLYTIPISVIILLTRVIGGDAVTADIFNWLATHWLPNIIFFVIFMLFAASFFGAFEITLPSSIVNKSDRQTGRAGLGGVFFMALTLVLVSFSCTGPIVGSVLIKSTQGEFWTPMVTMLAFSTAFALPFTLLAMFPSFLKKMKSGSWLNSVKVVLGFVEVALGFKFLSTADQTYHWGLLDREVYLSIWIVTFSLLGLYLLGKIRFRNDDPQEKPLTVTRLALAIAVFSFVVYLIPGMWGAPLKALSGYLPPLETQDFVVYNHADGRSAPTADSTPANAPAGNEYGLSLPLGLSGYFTLEEGLAASEREGKPVFVDVTGHGCVNCREMEQRVWSDPSVLEILRDRYIIVALYVDDKTKLEEKDYVTDDNGRIYKDLGRKNSYIARTRFGVNAQPNYILLDSRGDMMVPVRGYNLDVNGFVSFLNSGLEAFAGQEGRLQ